MSVREWCGNADHDDPCEACDALNGPARLAEAIEELYPKPRVFTEFENVAAGFAEFICRFGGNYRLESFSTYNDGTAYLSMISGSGNRFSITVQLHKPRKDT